MGFSMNDIKISKKINKNKLMSDLCKVIYEKFYLTPNVKRALVEYVKFRLYKIRLSNFTPQKFSKMIDELTEYITHKNLLDVTINDIIVNENQFLYEIAKSIFNKGINNLYYNLDYKSIVENKIKNAPKKLTSRRLNNEELENYFRGLMR